MQIRAYLLVLVALAGSLSAACAKHAATGVAVAPDQGAAPATILVDAATKQQIAKAERQKASTPGQSTPLTSAATVAVINAAAAIATTPTASGTARIGLLYFLDVPAHREAVLNWIKSGSGKVTFESQDFGYVEAEVDLSQLAALVAASGSLGLDLPSVLKFEFLDTKVGSVSAGVPLPSAAKVAAPAVPGDTNSSLFGPVHSAGYGAKVSEFRDQAALDLGLSRAQVAGQGRLIALFDIGVDLTRTDVFQDRIKDFVIGDDRLYVKADRTLADQEQKDGVPTLPDGLADLAGNATLRFATLSEAGLKFDLNGSGAATDDLAVAVYLKNGKPEARFRPLLGLTFGDPVQDFGEARKAAQPTTINLYTGKYYVRDAVHPSPSAAAVKFKIADDGSVLVAFVGTAHGDDHGVANLHMAGGNYADATGSVTYQGVAPAVDFLVMQVWHQDQSDYGAAWNPLARSMIIAASAGADVLDLDVYAPGTRAGVDMLEALTCRITATTNAVPLVAVHNFGPFPETIQSLAQSPCVLGIGASLSVAAMHDGEGYGSVDPALTTPDSVQTALYSGRGFGLNGQFKPDLISPAYGYTAYGPHFVRFGGTSGATPTTAGMVALLKQAAMAKGWTLGFDQATRLLQAGTMPTASTDLRDGFGFTNLLSTWTLLKSPGSFTAPSC